MNIINTRVKDTTLYIHVYQNASELLRIDSAIAAIEKAHNNYFFIFTKEVVVLAYYRKTFQ